MPSPPKPWEVNNANSGAAVVTAPSTAVSLTTPDVPARSITAVDSLTTPARPAAYSSTGYGSTGYGSTGYGSTGYGSTGYGSAGYGGYGSTGYGGYGSTGYGMGSSYNRYGSTTGSYGGGYGGYGSYGSHGGMGGYGGMNRYGGNFGRMGGPGGPDEIGLTQRMEMGTRPAFEVIENIVGSFGGFAQMLDSTFMATHSSFMAMVGVAEQLGFLKNYLGQIFSIFALYRLVKRAIDKVTGRVPAGKPMEMNVMEFQNFEQKASAVAGPKMSRKPLIIFMLMVVGLPYMMHKLIQLISSSQKLQQQQMTLNGGPNAAAAGAAAAADGIDPAKLEFARAMYDFNAESQMELTLKKGDIVAIICKTDPTTNAASQWWRGRLRDGTMGMFPANYVEIIQKAGPANNNHSGLEDATAALNEKNITASTNDSAPKEELATKLN